METEILTDCRDNYFRTERLIISETIFNKSDIEFKSYSAETDGDFSGFHKKVVEEENLPNPSHTKYSRKFVDDNGDIIAKCEFLKFKHSDIAYVGWLQSEYEGEGIGSTLRKEMLQEIGYGYTVYSRITNEKLYSVADRHGFEQIEMGNVDGWFVRR